MQRDGNEFWQVLNLQPGRTYHYKVRAICMAEAIQPSAGGTDGPALRTVCGGRGVDVRARPRDGAGRAWEYE